MLSKKGKLVALIFSVISLSVLKYVADYNAKTVPQVFQLIAYGALPIAGGLITLNFCSLLEPFSDAERSTTFRLLKQISVDPARNFFVGFLATGYLNFIRPPLVANLPFLPYMEWVTIALAVCVVYTVTGFSTKELYANSEALGWREHIQKVRREIGHDLMRVTSVMEQFVEHGVKEPLLVYLALHLQRLGATEESILNTLSPLIDYQENARRHKLYFLFFPWTRRKIAMKNKKAREDLLKPLVRKINRL